jgi:hypothetical protein
MREENIFEGMKHSSKHNFASKKHIYSLHRLLSSVRISGISTWFQVRYSVGDVLNKIPSLFTYIIRRSVSGNNVIFDDRSDRSIKNNIETFSTYFGIRN